MQNLKRLAGSALIFYVLLGLIFPVLALLTFVIGLGLLELSLLVTLGVIVLEFIGLIWLSFISKAEVTSSAPIDLSAKKNFEIEI